MIRKKDIADNVTRYTNLTPKEKANTILRGFKVLQDVFNGARPNELLSGDW